MSKDHLVKFENQMTESENQTTEIENHMTECENYLTEPENDLTESENHQKEYEYLTPEPDHHTMETAERAELKVEKLNPDVDAVICESPLPRASVNVCNLNAFYVQRCQIGNIHVNEVHNTKVVRELSLPKYMWKAMKKSTRLERITCAVVNLTVLFSISVIFYHFIVVANRAQTIREPSDWFIPRDKWLAKPYNESVSLQFGPPKLVVVQHTVTPGCQNFIECSAALEAIQDYYLRYLRHSDIPYNFLVGTDGRVYEGRGWGIASVSSRWFNPCLISIGFVGDYRHIAPTEQQLNRTNMLLAEGVRNGHLDPKYALLGAMDLLETESPGRLLYKALHDFEHYVHNNPYRHLCCEQIHEDNSFIDEAPHDWLIAREDWESRTYDNFKYTSKYDPLKLVIVNNIPTRDCRVFIICRSQMQNLQGMYFMRDTELPYNFMIGNDGRVYEARGWGVEGGEESLQFQPCALNIGFFGNYSDYESPFQTKVSPAQANRTQMLLKEGVNMNYLHKDYILVGASDIINTISPGEYLIEEIKTWEHYSSQSLDLETCESLHGLD